MTESKSLHTPHHLILEDRKKLTLSGVQDVDCFDEQAVVLFTNMGKLIIRGQNLHVNGFQVESGDFSMEGDIKVLEYAENENARFPFLARLFR